MRIIKTETMLVESGDIYKLTLNNNETGDTVVGEVYFQTPEDLAFTIKGTVDRENFNTLKAIDMANYAVVNSITTAGYYMIPAAGLQAVELTFAGSGEITIKETF